MELNMSNRPIPWKKTNKKITSGSIVMGLDASPLKKQYQWIPIYLSTLNFFLIFFPRFLGFAIFFSQINKCTYTSMFYPPHRTYLITPTWPLQGMNLELEILSKATHGKYNLTCFQPSNDWRCVVFKKIKWFVLCEHHLILTSRKGETWDATSSSLWRRRYFILLKKKDTILSYYQAHLITSTFKRCRFIVR